MPGSILPALDERKGFVWYNGDLILNDEAKIHMLTQSLHYASSVYEGCRIYNGSIFKIEEHIERLIKSAELLKLSLPYSKDDLINASHKVVICNSLEKGYVRPLIWRGSKSLKIGALDNKIEVMIAAWETASKDFYSQNPLNLSVSQWRKPPSNVMPVQCKSAGHYTMLIVSKYEAIEKGCDDALMLDMEGFIAECTTSNIFFVKDKNLYTPTIKYALDGITRKTVIEIARANHIKVFEVDIRLEDIDKYDEAFITGTAAEIQKISSIDWDTRKVKFSNFNITEYIYKEFLKVVHS